MCAGGQQREQPGEEERREFGRVDVGGDLPGVLGPADDAHQELPERVLRQLVFDRPRRAEVQSEHVPENRWAQTFFRAEHVLHELVEHRRQIAGGAAEFADDPGFLGALHLDEDVLLGREVEVEGPAGHARVGDDGADVGGGQAPL